MLDLNIHEVSLILICDASSVPKSFMAIEKLLEGAAGALSISGERKFPVTHD